MSYARQMLDSYPRTVNVDASVLAAAIDAISDCAQACISDTVADLSEQNLAEMVTCIRLCLDCTDICTATSGVISRLAEYDPVSPGRCWRHAWPSARAAAMSASGMRTTSTAGSASRPADAASGLAGSCWTPWNSKLGQPGASGSQRGPQRSFVLLPTRCRPACVWSRPDLRALCVWPGGRRVASPGLSPTLMLRAG